MYIVLEGIDTAGKSTQLALLQKHYPLALTTKEPGGTTFGTTVREIVLSDHTLDSMTEFLLFLADRREHFIQKIKPVLEKNHTLFSDRSFISGVAYAKANKTLDSNHLIELNKMVLNNTLPHGVVLFHIPRSVLKERLAAKSNDGIEKRGIDYLLEVQTNLIETTKHLNIKHIIVDASASIETIHEQILNFTKELV